MPICPNCGAHLGVDEKTCSCGTKIDFNLDKLLNEEAKKVEEFNDYKRKCLASFENKEYKEAVDYADMAINLDIGLDAEILFTRGKSLYYLGRFYDAVKSFDNYIKEYKYSFFRFADISGAYEWKAHCLWQLGESFESIKSYYNAFDYVDKKQCSNHEKMETSSRINEARRNVMNSSKGVGIYNPRLGEIDEDVYDWIQNQDDSILIMQNLYDAIGKVEDDNCKYKSLKMEDGLVYVEFDKDSEILEKRFDGTATFID